jgi:hypothetical protein
MKSNLKLFFTAWIMTGAAMMSCSTKKRVDYPSLAPGEIVLRGDAGQWDDHAVHTLSVVRAERDGFKYWGYYGVDYYNGPPEKRKAGLVRSNDLVHWEKYAGNPIIDANCRWPFVILTVGTFHLFYEEFNDAMESRIVRLSSRDGIHFSQPEEVVPLEPGLQNQNPFVFHDPGDKLFYLFYYHGKERGQGDHQWNIDVRKADDPSRFNESADKVILSSTDILASPSVMLYRGRYFLTVESFKPGRFDDKWVTRAYESPAIDGVFTETPNSPILRENDACAFQTVVDGKCVVFYSQRYDAEKNYWNVRMAREK